jgi:predicted Zn-dependent protease
MFETKKVFTYLIFGAFLISGFSYAQSEDLAEKSRRGKEAMAAQRYDEAISIYSELVRALPNEAGLRLNLGLAYSMADQPQKAIPQLEAAVKLQPNLVPALLVLGSSHLDLGAPGKAIGPLQKVIAAQPGNKDARHMLADAFLSLERYEQAAAQFQALTQVDSQNPRIWYGLGRSYEALSNRAFEQLEQMDPESPYLMLLAAEVLTQKKRYANAFALYRQALNKLPAVRFIHEALAEIYGKSGHPDWAAQEEEKASRIAPPDCSTPALECSFLAGRDQDVVAGAKNKKTAAAYYWSARAYNRLALQSFSRLGQLPPSIERHELAAEIHSAQGRYTEAVRELREALKLSPGEISILKRLAEALYQSRDLQGAQTLLEELLKRERSSAELNLLYGETLLESQQIEPAISHLRDAIKYDPRLLPAKASLGRAYLQIGKAQDAIPYLKEALQTDTDGSLHYQLARAYQSTGQAELSKQMMQKSREIQKSADAEQQKLEQEIQITPP